LKNTVISLVGLLQPRDQDDARLRIELIKAAGRNVRPYVTLVFAVLLGVFALHWKDALPVTLWTLLLSLYPALTTPLRRRVLNAVYTPDEAGKLTLRAVAVLLPLHVIWAFYVPMCWVAGDAANNAFLLIFALAGITAAIVMYGPCIFLSLPAAAAFALAAVTHPLRTGSWLDEIMPVLVLLFCAMLGLMIVGHYRTYRQSVARRRTIEALVRDLAGARDTAEQANRAKSAFLASMSHELRTPLNAIIGFSDMMRQGLAGPLTPRYQEYIEDIYSSGQHLLGLINDVLDISKIEAGKKEFKDQEIVLDDLAREVMHFVLPQMQQSGIKVRIDVAPDARLIADARAVRQILTNLLSNAVKFSPEGETVAIFARPAADGGLSLGVEDRGIGMTEDGIKKALEPYGQVQAYTTTVDGVGTGLGLPIAKALFEAHGAKFQIESTPGSGSRIWGEFPASRLPDHRRAA
jgi:signal transduction histidine kinase